jgi:hypothetical protein
MPVATLPSTPAGWLVALFASFVGFIAGFLAVSLTAKLLAGGGSG